MVFIGGAMVIAAVSSIAPANAIARIAFLFSINVPVCITLAGEGPSFGSISCSQKGPHMMARTPCMLAKIDEGRGAGARRPADVWLPQWGLHGAAALDLAVTSGLRAGAALAQSAQSGTAAVEAYEAHKRAHLHTDHHCASEGLQFLAEACSRGWGPTATATWRALGGLIAARSGDSPSVETDRPLQRRISQARSLSLEAFPASSSVPPPLACPASAWVSQAPAAACFHFSCPHLPVLSAGSVKLPLLYRCCPSLSQSHRRSTVSYSRGFWAWRSTVMCLGPDPVIQQLQTDCLGALNMDFSKQESPLYAQQKTSSRPSLCLANLMLWLKYELMECAHILTRNQSPT